MRVAWCGVLCWVLYAPVGCWVKMWCGGCCIVVCACRVLRVGIEGLCVACWALYVRVVSVVCACWAVYVPCGG